MCLYSHSQKIFQGEKIVHICQLNSRFPRGAKLKRGIMPGSTATLDDVVHIIESGAKIEEKYCEQQKLVEGAVDSIEAALGSELERTRAELDKLKSIVICSKTELKGVVRSAHVSAKRPPQGQGRSNIPNLNE